jgi:tripartite-type tricarboxylate transporter receptor subunit TctC
LFLASTLLAIPAGAQENFNNGKQINLVVGYGTGGGYDVYARLVGKHISRFIPGNPTVVVQNMPGAGSLRALNHIYNFAPKSMCKVNIKTESGSRYLNGRSSAVRTRCANWLCSASVSFRQLVDFPT